MIMGKAPKPSTINPARRLIVKCGKIIGILKTINKKPIKIINKIILLDKIHKISANFNKNLELLKNNLEEK